MRQAELCRRDNEGLGQMENPRYLSHCFSDLKGIVNNRKCQLQFKNGGMEARLNIRIQSLVHIPHGYHRK